MPNMIPEKYALSGTEDGQQIALFMWAQQNLAKWPELRWLFHCPNGGFRTKPEAARFRAMGVKSGVPDVLFLVPRGNWHGLMIEMKRPKTQDQAKGRLSDEQKEWQEFFKNNDYGVITCYSFQEARDCLIQYLEWGKDANGVTA